ncbi:WG repeat-containing protein [Puia dinghuensis]|nr:WG repeat-containing protein [Puia dinghuensis]
MNSIISFWFAPAQLALLFMIGFHAHAQPIKVGGYGIETGEFVPQFDGKYFTMQRKDGIAIIDLTGKMLTSGLKPPSTGIFRNLRIQLYKGVFFASNGNAIVLKNIAGQTLGTGIYSDVSPFVTGNTAVRAQGQPSTWIVAYVDTTGKEIVRFDVMKYLALADPASKLKGTTLVTLNQFQPFSDGLTPIKSQVTGKYGYINRAMQLPIPVTFKSACTFSEGLAAVQNTDGLWGFIDTKGKLIIPCHYTYSPGRFASGLAKVQNREGKYGYINKNDQVVITPRFAYATTFYKGYALAKEGYTTQPILIDSNGAVVTTFLKNTYYIDDSKPGTGISGGDQLEDPFYISETLRELVDEGKGIFLLDMLKYGLVDNKGNVVLDFKYKYMSDLHGGKLLGYIDKTSTAPYQIGILDDKGDWLVLFVESEF